MGETRRLYLLRHGKSSWDDLDLDDHDRPLAPRGTRATAVMADHLRRANVAPDLVLCSSAKRTRETLEGIRDALDRDVVERIEQDLYAASARHLLERVRALDDGTKSVMLIGHNPGIEDLALDLAGSGRELEAMERKFPTGAMATLVFNGRWRDLKPGSAELAEFVTPKRLTKS
jgi:phosphohistidine phosphatase